MSTKPVWVRLFPSDFLGGCALMPGRQRAIYSYLLVLQANHGAVRMEPQAIAEHLEAPISDVQAVLDFKFDFNPEINGWQNDRMREEVNRAGAILKNKREGAEKARRKKEESERSEPEPEPDSEINPEISVDFNPDSKGLEDGRKRPTLEQALAAAETIGISPQMAEEWWYCREASDWTKGTAGGGTTPVGANWQADLKTYANRMAQNNSNTKTNGPRKHDRNAGTALGKPGQRQPTAPRPPGV